MGWNETDIKGNVLAAKNSGKKPDPSKWGWKTNSYTITNKVKRYTVKVSWKDVGKTAVKEYILSSLKADVRER